MGAYKEEQREYSGGIQGGAEGVQWGGHTRRSRGSTVGTYKEEQSEYSGGIQGGAEGVQWGHTKRSRGSTGGEQTWGVIWLFFVGQ